MATLNIKNLPDGLYKKLQARASKPLSILELQGLGKEQWKDLDAAVHVQRERDAWD